jgi:hypothetical protein
MPFRAERQGLVMGERGAEAVLHRDKQVVKVEDVRHRLGAPEFRVQWMLEVEPRRRLSFSPDYALQQLMRITDHHRR